MKKYNLKWTSMIAVIMLLTFTACNNEQAAGEAEGMEMADDMGEMEGMGHMGEMEMMQESETVAAVSTEGEPAFVVAYMDIKNALVNDNYEQVQQAASSLQEGLENSELTEAQQSQLKELAGQLAEAQDIMGQRQSFARLSQELYEVVKNNDVTENKLYWQHCPMALNNQGANWLSFEEQVRNPFMGQKMPGCGSVEETL
ncbi:uncharacterized protein DUF3347 [Pontibacter ummariensis]|uniref:DUF3347 domain-containing protein n=1 Tax=Pontibacter ummariensis TaxID=1610492 RepID=A0A239DP20_9BACT|nr:DUF3347 domain-containing protein [Pontibacter ummariensis]PRY13823.1 uncharacterized protein DUF3347 [Pontibacter ummariensis]SNS34240.1 Protein of unknown function [Pontibacter ummariensis]